MTYGLMLVSAKLTERLADKHHSAFHSNAQHKARLSK